MKKGKLKIYLFRHGQTYYNKNHVFTGFKDSKLTPLGIKQAKVIAKKLKDKKFEVAYYTRLSRSKDTLKEVLRFHPECKRLIKEDRMIERSYGKLSGTHHSTVVRKLGQEQYDIWHRSFGIRPPSGESFADVKKRVKPFIEDLKKFMKKNQVSVAISAHGNSIRLFRHILEGTSEEETCSWFIPYDKVFVYEL
ncbi:MAG: 2,3-bisphosphoglycerate-dependent phosphoglycerate mutase [archaeon]